MPFVNSSDSSSPLASRLRRFAAAGTADMPYRLARIVARVLVSSHLQQRRKWCSLAQALAEDPSVEDRLVIQAMGRLRREPALPSNSPIP